jgi:hypothetical protein
MVQIACAALLLAFSGCSLGNLGHNSNQTVVVVPTPSQPSGPKNPYMWIEGPSFGVQKSPGYYETVQISQIFIELDPALEPAKRNLIVINITSSRFDIKEALQNIILKVGYQNLFIDEKRSLIENRLRQEVVRILGGSAADKDIKDVILGKCMLSS